MLTKYTHNLKLLKCNILNQAVAIDREKIICCQYSIGTFHFSVYKISNTLYKPQYVFDSEDVNGVMTVLLARQMGSVAIFCSTLKQRYKLQQTGSIWAVHFCWTSDKWQRMDHGQLSALFPYSISDGEKVQFCKLTNIIFHSFNLFYILYSALQLYCFLIFFFVF